MKVLVARNPSEADWTLSHFFFDRLEKGVGVEDEHREVKVFGETCIPEGIYDMKFHISPKFSHYFYRDDNGHILEESMRITDENKKRFHTPHELIQVMNVPGFDGILWHWGNTDDDTHGCYIVGSIFGDVKGQKGVLQSKMKYKEIYPILWNAIKNDSVTVEYKTL